MQKHKHTRTLTTRQVLTGAAAFGGWKSDAPGVRRHMRPSDLPPPATGKDPEGSIAKIVKVVEAPKGALPKLPDGFAVQVFASGFKMPRTLRIAPNGMSFCPRAAPVGHGITSATERIPH